MNRRVLFLSLLLFFSCSKNSDETTPPVVGRWTLVAQQDGTGAWVNFIPFVPVQFEFRADGSFDYVEPNGKPQRGCCQPTRYSLKAGSLLTPSPSSQWVPTTVTFTDWVSCPNVNCALIQTWTVLQVSDQFLDLDLSEGKTPAQHFRYQRTR
jgi:hypothetical protein